MVLLIGGCPLSGKTTLAKTLSNRTGIHYISSDDVESLYRLHSKQSLYNDITYQEFYTRLSVEERFSRLQAWHACIEESILQLSSNYLATGVDLILEGYGIYPSILKKTDPTRVLGIWISISDTELCMRISQSRDQLFRGHSQAIINGFRSLCSFQNKYILKECTLSGLMCYDSDQMLKQVESLFATHKSIIKLKQGNDYLTSPSCGSKFPVDKE